MQANAKYRPTTAAKSAARSDAVDRIRALDGSVMSFPERGPWGDSRWVGNASGFAYGALFAQLQPRVYIDVMSGSGTALEVAADMGIEAYGLDLKDGFDAASMSILEAVGKPADFVFSHPPYGPCLKYSGSMWGSEPHPSDLSHCATQDEFHEKLAGVLLNQREATLPGGVYGTLIGDYRKDGVYYNYMSELIARLPRSELAGVLIKLQHQTTSSRKSYQKMKMPFITHEYVCLWTRKRTIQSAVSCLREIARVHAERLRSTWRVIVRSVLVQLGGKASLQELYDAMRKNAPEKVANNPNFAAKVRQVVQVSPDFVRVERGVWALAPARFGEAATA